MQELREYGIEPMIADPQADAAEAERLYGVTFCDMASIRDVDAVILAVAHTQFATLTVADLDKLYGSGRKVLVDVKGILDRGAYENAGYLYWRL